MGIGTSSRGHYRPLSGGFNRSPSFLVAALTIGFFIIAFSYWRLALQYHDLEVQLRHLVQRKDSLEASQSIINKQLEQREENFSEAKVSLQKKEQQVEDLQKRITETEKELKEIRVNVDSMKQSNEKLKTELTEKDKNIESIRSQNKKLEEEKIKLEEELKKFKTQPIIKVSETLQSPGSGLNNAQASVIIQGQAKSVAESLLKVKPIQQKDNNIFKQSSVKQLYQANNQIQAPDNVKIDTKPDKEKIDSLIRKRDITLNDAAGSIHEQL